MLVSDQTEWGLADDWDWQQQDPDGGWAEMLSEGANAEQDRILHHATKYGLPFGDEDSVTRLEKTFNRRLRLYKPDG